MRHTPTPEDFPLPIARSDSGGADHIRRVVSWKAAAREQAVQLAGTPKYSSPEQGAVDRQGQPTRATARMWHSPGVRETTIGRKSSELLPSDFEQARVHTSGTVDREEMVLLTFSYMRPNLEERDFAARLARY